MIKWNTPKANILSDSVGMHLSVLTVCVGMLRKGLNQDD